MITALLSVCAAVTQMQPAPRVDARVAADAMVRAVRFFRASVASNGGYLWKYGDDLVKREGEGKADPDCVWVQPPGTPAVGMAYLTAYERTGKRYLLEAAREVGQCLVRGQLRSGGWAYEIRFDPRARERIAYRVDPERQRAQNVSTLDDDTTQAATRFLVRLDRALRGRDKLVREAADTALGAILAAQYPNGAWPQRFSGPVSGEGRPVLCARLSEVWPRMYAGVRYDDLYTLNDNLMATAIDTLLEAWELRKDRRCRDAALRGGDFLVRAQLPEPQPGWAQQYNREMEPAWARKFEPPAVTGGESQQTMRTLIALAERTREARFLKPIPSALAYYRRSLLPDGRLARFYEIGTNRPLYFTRKYELTYDDSDTPTHYAFKIGSQLDAIEREHARVSETLGSGRRRAASVPKPEKPPSDADVARVIASLDTRGAWVEDGRLSYHGDDDPTTRVISSATFAKNLDVLSRYLARNRR